MVTRVTWVTRVTLVTRVTTIMEKSPWDSAAICIFFRHFSVPS